MGLSWEIRGGVAKHTGDYAMRALLLSSAQQTAPGEAPRAPGQPKELLGLGGGFVPKLARGPGLKFARHLANVALQFIPAAATITTAQQETVKAELCPLVF